MAFEFDKIMFEIYRETEYTGKYRVVYFTELQDHNKESEINHAMAGEHLYDGFLRSYRKDALPTSLYSRRGAPRLVIVTCGGPFDRRTGRYRDNVVLTAVPA